MKEAKVSTTTSHIFPRLLAYQGNIALVLESYGYAKAHNLDDLDDMADDLLNDFFEEYLEKMQEADFKSLKRQLVKDFYSNSETQMSSWDPKETYDLKLHGLYGAIEDMMFRFTEISCRVCTKKIIS
jgi:hypothetical protein